MSWNNKVVWSEGLFLRPQHFQQHDRYLENFVEGRCSGLRTFPWGFTTLKIDSALLPEQTADLLGGDTGVDRQDETRAGEQRAVGDGGHADTELFLLQRDRDGILLQHHAERLAQTMTATMYFINGDYIPIWLSSSRPPGRSQADRDNPRHRDW